MGSKHVGFPPTGRRCFCGSVSAAMRLLRKRADSLLRISGRVGLRTCINAEVSPLRIRSK
ncbi:unnamed protein product [Amoebophrya sp. A120]|nr:unnamed protein product [Amoebophrya sp. A120]|eukprot:GSA120T00023193001.1